MRHMSDERHDREGQTAVPVIVALGHTSTDPRCQPVLSCAEGQDRIVKHIQWIAGLHYGNCAGNDDYSLIPDRPRAHCLTAEPPDKFNFMNELEFTGIPPLESILNRELIYFRWHDAACPVAQTRHAALGWK